MSKQQLSIIKELNKIKLEDEFKIKKLEKESYFKCRKFLKSWKNYLKVAGFLEAPEGFEPLTLTEKFKEYFREQDKIERIDKYNKEIENQEKEWNKTMKKRKINLYRTKMKFQKLKLIILNHI